MQVLVVQAAGHDRLARRLGDAVVDQVSRSPNQVHSIDLLADGFVPWMSGDERAAYLTDTPLSDPLTSGYAAAVQAATALVMVDRPEFGNLSPLLKGWLEKVFVPGVAFVLNPRTQRVRPGLHQLRRIVGIGVGPECSAAARDTVQRTMWMCTSLRTRTHWIEATPGADDLVERTVRWRADHL